MEEREHEKLLLSALLLLQVVIEKKKITKRLFTLNSLGFKDIIFV